MNNSLYAQIALEAVRQRKLERKHARYYDRCYPELRPLVWGDMADAYDQQRYCRYLLCEPDQIGQSSVSY